MTLKLNIKRKDARFKGDRNSYNAVVSGPTETFAPKLRRFLELQGFTPFKEDDGFSIWTTPYSIGGPLTYLAPILRDKYRVSMTSNTRHLMDAAFSERKPQDGLERFLGNAALSPGRRALTVIAGREDFVANCDEEDLDRREALEAAGWIPIIKVTERLRERLGSRPYRTRNPLLASNLEGFMSEGAKALLARIMGQLTGNIKISKSQNVPEGFSTPSPEGVEYLPFQKGGIHAVSKSGKGAIIADDMGLGKTIQGIGILNDRPDASDVLIICQANMKLKWVKELDKWMVNKTLSVGYAEGSKMPETNVVVINYDILAKNEDLLRDRKWDVILIDEAHNLKNEEAIRTKVALGDLMDVDGKGPLPVAENGQVVHLTGTPKPNKVSELWPLLTSSRPDYWGRGPEARQVFLNRYQPPFLIKKKIRKGSHEFETIIPMDGKPIREMELQLGLRGSGSFIRRLKRDTDLPPKFRTPLEIAVRLTKEEKALLREAEADLEILMARVSNTETRVGESRQARHVIDTISLLDPDTPEFFELARVRRNLGLIKAPHCADFILSELEDEKDMAEENRTKTVVFAHHKEVIQTIYAEAERRMKGTFLIYDGSVKPKDRQNIIDRFQEDPDIRGIIISLAGATGITLTASARMRVVEPDWTPSNMVQIEDRIWRIGQEKNVDIGYLAVAGTLDSRVGGALVSKMETDERSINTLKLRHSRLRPSAASGDGVVRKTEEPVEKPAEERAQGELSL